MVDDVFGELFLDDGAEAGSAASDIVPPVTVSTSPAETSQEPAPTALVTTGVAPVVDEPPAVPAAAPSPAPVTAPRENPRADRERRLAKALNLLMQENHEIEAAALVSLDGFPMASALPEGMQEDRVGAMSAAILGLGERAAVELGRGKLSQVFIEGEEGYVLLMAAGDRAVLTCLADRQAKLGLVIYEMRRTAGEIGEILG